MPKYNSKRNFFIVKKKVIKDSTSAYRRKNRRVRLAPFTQIRMLKTACISTYILNPKSVK
jgi:hypothetical protein